MGSLERRRRQRDEVRTKILDAARELFAREGVEAVSMRKVAEAIEYSPTAIYLHFKDKGSLLAELCAHDFGALAERFKESALVEDPVERVRAIGASFVRFSLEHPNHFRFMFLTPGGHHEEIPDGEWAKRGDPERDAYARLRHAVAEAVARGRFGPPYDDVDLATQTFAAAMYGVAAMHAVMGNDPWIEWAPVERRVRAMQDAVLAGMTRDAGVRPRKARGPATRDAGGRR